MSKTIKIKFPTTLEEFEQQLQSHSHDLQECELIIITSVPSAAKGLEIISNDWFIAKARKLENLFGINLRIDEKFNLKYFSIHFNLKDSFFVAIQSTGDDSDCKTFWKSGGSDKFYSLYIENGKAEGIVEFFHEFLASELRNGRTGE